MKLIIVLWRNSPRQDCMFWSIYCKLRRTFSVSQIAQIDLVKAMGLQPDGIVGHSVGELACGYADNSLSHEEAILAAYWRGRCIKDAKLPAGGMAAVGR